MDPTGGINPSSPRLDSVAPAANQPVAQPNMGMQQPVAPIVAPSVDAVPVPDFNPGIPADIADVSAVDIPAEAEAPKSGKLVKVILIVVGVIVVLGMVAGGYFVGFSAGKSKGQSAAAADYQKKLAAQQAKTDDDTAPAEDTTDQSASTDKDAKLTIGNLQDPKYIDETVNGAVGKQVAASDGLILKVTSIERNFKPDDPNYKLDSSKELVKVNFLIGNATTPKPKDVSNFNFRLENSSGAQLTPENIASYQDKFDTVKLDPGAQGKGAIVYAVNKDEKPLKFVRSQTYRISDQNKEVTTKIVITVAS